MVVADAGGNLSSQAIPSGSMTAEQANRIENTDKINSFIKTANFLWSPDDVHVTSGTTDNGKKSIVTNETGTSIEGEMEDADMCEGCIVRIRNIGAASEIVNYFADGETGLFRNLAGTTGNEWTVGGSSQFLGTKEAGVITVDGGTVSTRTFEIYTLANAANPTSDTNATTGASGVTNWTVSSVSTSPTPQNGTHSLKWTHGGPDNTTYNGQIDLTGLNIVVGQTYEIKMYVNRFLGGNFSIVLDIGNGWSVTSTVTIGTVSDPVVDVWREITLTGTWDGTGLNVPAIRVTANTNADADHAFGIDNIRIIRL
jgi:hypothetical protein